METQCITEQMEFQQLGRRAVIGRFDGGTISSDGGAVLLREVDKRTGISERLARCFRDYRKAQRIEHPVVSRSASVSVGSLWARRISMTMTVYATTW